MTDNSNLSDRVAALEKSVSGRNASGGRLGWWIGGLILMAMLTYNVRLIRQEQLGRQQINAEHLFWIVCHGSFPSHERADAFLQLLAQGNKEWRGAHLDGLNLEGVALNAADLQGTDMSGSALTRGTFVGAKFNNCKLRQTDFSNSDLSGASLAGVDLYRAILHDAQLRKANLRGATLEQVQAQGAILLAADLADSWDLMVNLSGADLSGADLAGANLEAANLRGANLSLARFSGANLKDADFTDSNWWKSRGLNSDQITWLRKTFAPGEKATPAVREDYENWLKKLEPSQ
jgi:uncharacterized protein YjbI with pentapeptide repeats